MNVEVDFIKEALDAGLNKQAIKIISSLIHQTSSIEAPVPCHIAMVGRM